MSGEGELNLDSAEKRRTLWIVFWLNVAIAIGFFITGVIGDSNALIGCISSGPLLRSCFF